MRSHVLSRLNLAGRESVLGLEPDFDFYRARRVLELHLDFQTSNDLPLLRLLAEYTGESNVYAIDMQFEGIRRLSLPEFAPWFVLSELEIEDVSAAGLEGIGFEAVSQFDRSFQCACRAISIVGFRVL